MRQAFHFFKKQGVNSLAYLAIVLALLTIVIIRFSSNKADQNSQHITTSYQVLQQSERLLTGIKDMQIGQRGYLLFGQEAYLTPYYTGKKDVEESFQALRQLTSGNALQQTHLETVDQNLQRAFAFIDKTVAEVKAYGPDSAQAIILAKDEGKVIMETLC